MILFSSEIFVVLLLWLHHLLVTLLTAIVFKLTGKELWMNLKVYSARAGKVTAHWYMDTANYAAA